MIAGQLTLQLTVQSVLSQTQLRVGPFESPFRSDPTIPARLFPYSGGTMQVDDQERSPIQAAILGRAVYEEEPVVALRSVLVDQFGTKFSADNPLPTASAPFWDEIDLTYNATQDLATATFTKGSLVTTLTLSYDSFSNLISVVRS